MLTTNPRYQAVVANLAILGIDINTLPRDANDLPVLSPGEIKKAYHDKLKVTHPDLSEMDPAQAEAETRRINTAWEELNRLLNLQQLLQRERDERERIRTDAQTVQTVPEEKISPLAEGIAGDLSKEAGDFLKKIKSAHANGRGFKFTQ